MRDELGDDADLELEGRMRDAVGEDADLELEGRMRDAVGEDAVLEDEGRMRDAAGQDAVVTRGLGVHYGEVRALTDVTVRIRSGEITGLVGVNGSGKSSTLAAVLERVPHEGTVRILGRSPKEARRAGLVASVPQAEAVDWDFPVTVRDVVTTGRYGRMGLLRIPRAADRAAVDDAIALLGLTHLAGRQIGELSGGQRKRAFVARAIAQDAELMLLDEPFAGVDRTSEAAITEVLRSLRDRGRSVVIVHHDLTGVAELVDSVLLLQRGRLLHHGPPAETLTPERIAAAFGAGRPQAEQAERAPADAEHGGADLTDPDRTDPDRTDPGRTDADRTDRDA